MNKKAYYGQFGGQYVAERHRFTMQNVCLQNTVQKFI